MPELPEVETVVRDLRVLLCGRSVVAVNAGRRKLRQPWKNAWIPRVIGRQIDGVRRRGKWIVVELDDQSHLLIHLGMTGQLTVRATSEPREPHTHVVFDLDDGSCQLRFRDVRRFGSVRYFPAEFDIDYCLNKQLGPEPWELEPENWHVGWRQSRRCLKAILLDQTIVAGIGNIYADEALHAARLSPRQTGRATSLAQAERIRLAIVEVLERAIAARGTSISDYIGGSGLRGHFQGQLQVYGRAALPCVRCGSAIVVVRLAGRSTHYCPTCQRTAAKSRPRRNRRALPQHK